MQADTPLQIAVVGSGPSGCFLAQALNRKRPQDVITVIDQLAAPYGLIRYGVATDHQQTKAITRQFDRLFAKENIRFAGNLEIGSEITIQHLQEHFDVVVLATGRPNARQLDIEGSDLEGVFTSADIIYSLNSFRGKTDVFTALGEHIVLVGGGNVALDILRFLIKEHTDYVGSDVNDAALQTYLEAPVSKVTVLNRSTIDDAKSDAAMLKELGAIEGVQFVSNHGPVETDEAKSPGARRRTVVEELTEKHCADPRVVVDFRFEATPTRFSGAQKLEQVEITDSTTGEKTILEADSVVTAVGFNVDDKSPIYQGYEHLMTVTEDSGRIEPGLYRTGWLKRGAVGTIPANRACAQDVAKEILADIDNGAIASNGTKPGFEALQNLVSQAPISFQQWQSADELERNLADQDRVRRKFVGQQEIIQHALEETS